MHLLQCPRANWRTRPAPPSCRRRPRQRRVRRRSDSPLSSADGPFHPIQPLRRLLVAGLLAAAAGLAQAQSAAPIRILVGFPPGGGTDAIARALADKLKDQLGAPVVVENRAGAGGQIAAQALKAAAPDGHTFFLSHDHSVSILPLVTKNPGFDPATDFVPVAGFATFANALAVSGGTPAKSMADYVAWCRAGGGKDTIGVPAPASIPEFLVKLIGAKYKLDVQAAPYRGSAPMMADMLGNQIQAGVASIPTSSRTTRPASCASSP